MEIGRYPGNAWDIECLPADRKREATREDKQTGEDRAGKEPLDRSAS
jgi:hypothetical protein